MKRTKLLTQSNPIQIQIFNKKLDPIQSMDESNPCPTLLCTTVSLHHAYRSTVMRKLLYTLNAW